MLDERSEGDGHTAVADPAQRDILLLHRDPDNTASDDEHQRPSARETSPREADRKADEDGGSNREDGKDDAEDDEDKPGLIRRHPLAFVIGAVAAVILVAAGVFYWLVFSHPYEATDDAFVDARSYAVSPKVSGYLVDVPVTDNQHVGTGAILFQIDRRDYQTALDQARAQDQAAQAQIESAKAQIEAQQSSIKESQAQVEQAKASLQFAKQDAARYQDLAQKGAGTIQQSQQSTSNLQQQEANLSRANAAVSAAQAQIGSLKAQQANAEASLAQARAQEEQAELNLSYTTLRAAQPGRVVRLTGAKGQFVQAGQSLSMFVPDEIWVTANYKETQITAMRPGQPVQVRIDAYPDRGIQGHVASVQPGSGTAFSVLPAQNATGNYIKVVQRIPVKIVVDRWPTDVSIGPGMSIVPTVQVREVPWYGRSLTWHRDTVRVDDGAPVGRMPGGGAYSGPASDKP